MSSSLTGSRFDILKEYRQFQESWTMSQVDQIGNQWVASEYMPDNGWSVVGMSPDEGELIRSLLKTRPNLSSIVIDRLGSDDAVLGGADLH